jgi:hypothetical protein
MMRRRMRMRMMTTRMTA